MTDRELMQQALDALEEGLTSKQWRELITALRERLAQPEQEPVAWANEIIDDLHAQYNTDGIKEIDSGDALIRLDEAIAAVEEAEKRYTTPPQRKPLQFPTMLRKMWSGAEVQKWINENWEQS
jgi:hypothetical protein